MLSFLTLRKTHSVGCFVISFLVIKLFIKHFTEFAKYFKTTTNKNKEADTGKENGKVLHSK